MIKESAAAVAARLWKHLHGPAQWRLLWLRHDKFMVGVTGVVLDDHGRALLLKHRFWKDCPWGTPSGYIEAGETVEQGFAREVAEETELQVGNVRVHKINSGFRLRMEVSVIGELIGSQQPRVDGVEVVEARFFTVDELPEGLRATQRDVILAATRA